MAVKPTQDKTKKYSSIVKNIQNIQPKEEPRITPEQVVAAFQSFGFTPNTRNHNDIGYWTTKGQSEGVKLMEELHKRRMDINNSQDAIKKNEDLKNKTKEDLLNKQNESKGTLPRLNDQDITALFDEYGLPTPDPEWARNHLPNDPKKIRSILDMQRKTADDMLKKHSKNAVNAIPEQPKMMGGSGMLPTPMPMNGMGGPTSPLGMQNGMIQGNTPATPFFVGESAVVRITNPTNPNASTLWLVDPKRKILQPFMSEQAFQNAFDDPAEAEKSIITISSKELAPGGALDGFEPLKGTQGVGHDGIINKVDFSKAQLQSRYGKQSDPTAENKALSMLDGILGNIQK